MSEETQEIMNEDEFWDDGALELSEEEVEAMEATEEVEEDAEDIEENTDEEVEESEQEEGGEVEEEDEEEEDETFAKGYDIFKENIFKYLPEDYEFKATEKGFEEALNVVEDTIAGNIHSQYLNQLESNPKAKAYLDFLIKTEGQGDFEKWQKVYNTDITSFQEEDMSDNEIAKVVYSEYLKFQGLEDEDILQKLEDAEDFGTLEKEAKIALKYIPKIQKEQSEELLKDYYEQKRSRDEVYQSNYNILSETAKQIKLPKEKGQQLVDSIMKPVRTQGGYETTMFNYMLNRVQTNPQHILQLASLIMDYDEEKGFNFDAIASKKENTKVARNFREKLTELEKAAPISRSKGSYKSHKRDKAPDITEGEFF